MGIDNSIIVPYTVQVMKVIAATLAFASILAARDVNATFDLIKKGAALPPAEAAKLEAHLNQKPSDKDTRVQLLAFYSSHPASVDLAAIKQARSRHISWLIQNDPKEALGLYQIATG